MELILEILIEIAGEAVFCEGSSVAGDKRIKLWIRILVFGVITLLELAAVVGVAVLAVCLFRQHDSLPAVIFLFMALAVLSCWIKLLVRFIRGLH